MHMSVLVLCVDNQCSDLIILDSDRKSAYYIETKPIQNQIMISIYIHHPSYCSW